MNYTDRSVHRGRSPDKTAARQKHHFARVRSMLQTTDTTRPLPDPCASRSSRPWPPTPFQLFAPPMIISTDKANLQHSRTANSAGHPKGLVASHPPASPHPAKVTLEVKRRRLLETANWAGVDLNQRTSDLVPRHSAGDHCVGRPALIPISSPSNWNPERLAPSVHLTRSSRLRKSLKIRIGSDDVRVDQSPSNGCNSSSTHRLQHLASSSSALNHGAPDTEQKPDCKSIAATRRVLSQIRDRYPRTTTGENVPPSSLSSSISSRPSQTRSQSSRLMCTPPSLPVLPLHLPPQTTKVPSSHLLQPKPLRVQRHPVLDGNLHMPRSADVDSIAVQISSSVGTLARRADSESEDWWHWATGHLDEECDPNQTRQQDTSHYAKPASIDHQVHHRIRQPNKRDRKPDTQNHASLQQDSDISSSPHPPNLAPYAARYEDITSSPPIHRNQSEEKPKHDATRTTVHITNTRNGESNQQPICISSSSSRSTSTDSWLSCVQPNQINLAFFSESTIMTDVPSPLAAVSEPAKREVAQILATSKEHLAPTAVQACAQIDQTKEGQIQPRPSRPAVSTSARPIKPPWFFKSPSLNHNDDVSWMHFVLGDSVQGPQPTE